MKDYHLFGILLTVEAEVKYLEMILQQTKLQEPFGHVGERWTKTGDPFP